MGVLRASAEKAVDGQEGTDLDDESASSLARSRTARRISDATTAGRRGPSPPGREPSQLRGEEFAFSIRATKRSCSKRAQKVETEKQKDKVRKEQADDERFLNSLPVEEVDR